MDESQEFLSTNGSATRKITASSSGYTLLHNALVEFLATTLFVFVALGIPQTIASENGSDTANIFTIAFTTGLAIFTMVSSTASISGGHLNPAASIAIYLADPSFKLTGLISYVIAQCAGATLGAFALKGVFPEKVLKASNYGCNALSDNATVGNGVMIEIVMTMILIFTILLTAVDKKGTVCRNPVSDPLAPLAIGMAVTLDLMLGIPITGASMNPARSLGPAIVSGFWDAHWIFWVGPISGAVLAAGFYILLKRTRKSRPGYVEY
eukprot:m.177770 g.177770  ORF g.177770 m.177770 type:complete len:267 (-) comp14634_c1_seq2:74-874(-)